MQDKLIQFIKKYFYVLMKGVISLGKEIMTTISVRLSQEEKDKLQSLAKEQDLSMSHLIRKAIKQYLQNN